MVGTPVIMVGGLAMACFMTRLGSNMGINSAGAPGQQHGQNGRR